MPSRNPKHNKKAFYERKMQYESRSIPIKYFVMGFIFVISITGVVLLAIFLPDSDVFGNKIYIEDGDTAEVHYKLWKVDEIDDLDTNSPPTQESKNFVTEVSKDALINGFYYELIDKREIGEIFEFVIDKETDANGDGFDDDNPDEEILGYADGKILYFWVQVLNITKPEDIPESSSLDNIDLPVQMGNLSDNYLHCSVRKFFLFDFLNNN